MKLSKISKRIFGLSWLLAFAAFGIVGTKCFAPYHRMVAIGLFASSVVCFFLSLQRRRALVRKHKARLRNFFSHYGWHAVLALLLLVLLYCINTLVPFSDSPLVKMSANELRAELEADQSASVYLEQTFGQETEQLCASIERISPDTMLTGEAKSQLQKRWARWIDQLIDLELLKKKYSGFYQVDYVAQPRNHVDSFGVTYSLFCAQYANVVRLQKSCSSRQNVKNVLNEAEPELGVNAAVYNYLLNQLTHPKNVLRLNAGRSYMRLLDKELKTRPTIYEPIKKNLSFLDKNIIKTARLVIKNPLARLERAATQAFFPIQKSVALNMGYMRVSDRPYAIQPEHLQPHIEKMQPGDILLERRNWHISNAGIPGFWPHAALYTGTLEELDAFFSGTPQLHESTFSETLQRTAPEVYQAYKEADKNGYPMRVLEGKNPYVRMFSLEESANCDFFAALRTTCSKDELFSVLMEGYRHYEKPYDFNFDFSTDDELVCSELVYKSYLASGKLPLTLDEVNGRPIIPPNNIARLVEKNAASLRCVLFLESRIKSGEVVASSPDSFAGSWSRSKWSSMQQ